MFATKLRALAAVAMCCGLALACTVGAIHFANAQPTPGSLPYPLVDVKPADRPAPEAEKKLPTAIPLKKLNAKSTAEKLLKLLPEAVTVAAARDENTLLVYATAKGTEDVRLVLRTLGEELPKEAAKPAEAEKYTFRMKSVPWSDVLDWYSKETGLTMITTVKPTGTFTFSPPEGKQFTLNEITDILNEVLAQQKFILIRRKMTFFIHPTDEKLDFKDLPRPERIELSELPNRGKTEIVQVILPLKNFIVADIQDEVKKLLSPFGSLVPLEKQNALLIQDTVGNIIRIREVLEKVEGATPPGDALDYACKWRPAQGIAETLKTLLTDKDTSVTVAGTQEGVKVRGKTVLIAVDARRNAILVVAAPDKLALAKKIIAGQDKPRNPNDKPFVVPEPVLKTYAVPPGSAAEIAKALVADNAELKVVPLDKQNQVMVLATPEEHVRVEKLIKSKEKGEKPTKTHMMKFDKKPWKDVFAWYATESGLTRVGDTLPTGTFTFVPPVPENPQEVFSPALSLDQITDYINEALLAQKWLLVRGKTTFAVLPADEKVDPQWIRRVKLDELNNLGRTELVEIIFFLEGVVGADVIDDVRKLTGPFGHVFALDKPNALIIRDTVGNLLRIKKTLDELTAKKP